MSMQLSTAVLCDYAQVRDRLLFVSSGAVTRLYRPELPLPIGLMLGLVVEVPIEETTEEHELVTRVITRGPLELADLTTTFRVDAEDLFPHEVQQVPMVVSLSAIKARTWGTHEVQLSLDGELAQTLTFYVVPSPGLVTTPELRARHRSARKVG